MEIVFYYVNGDINGFVIGKKIVEVSKFYGFNLVFV